MNIYVFSDSHTDTSRMLQVIENNKHRIDYIIHLGDNDSDADYISQSYFTIPVAAVAGNCDMFSRRRNEILVKYGSKRLLLTHGANIVSAGCYGGALRAAKDEKADGVLFGHTHVPYCETIDGILLFNPGSITLPRGGSTYSYGIIEINDDVMTAKCVNFD